MPYESLSYHYLQGKWKLSLFILPNVYFAHLLNATIIILPPNCPPNQSEVDGKFTEVLRTTAGHGTLTRLEPGRSYRFRVHSLNADGVAGPSSPSVLVHTLIETPAAPVAPPKFVQARKVRVVVLLLGVFFVLFLKLLFLYCTECIILEQKPLFFVHRYVPT